jgi:hypothetical protein
MNDSFQLSDVDLSTVSMVSDGTGSVSRIPATASKSSHLADTDHDGVAEIAACFARADLARLFSAIRGRQEVQVAIEGHLNTGGEFHATLPLTVVGTPGADHRSAVSISPNPMNPGGLLKFTTRTPGYVSARVFDLRGRLVRTIARAERLDAGDHTLILDGHADRGATLATGVYFYLIETPDGVSSGRFVVAK